MHGDVSAVAKALRDFGRANPHLVVKGGILDGDLLTTAQLSALADLPSRDVLLARFAGAIAAPLRQMAGLLEGPAPEPGLRALRRGGRASGRRARPGARGPRPRLPRAAAPARRDRGLGRRRHRAGPGGGGRPEGRRSRGLAPGPAPRRHHHDDHRKTRTERRNNMAGTLTKEQILDGIAELSVLELSELLKEFEERFGVTAAAPVAVAAAPAAGGGGCRGRPRRRRRRSSTSSSPRRATRRSRSSRRSAR